MINGKKKELATINGKTYVLSRPAASGGPKAVQVTIKQQEHNFQFTLLSIEPDQVQMEFQGQPFHLKVKDKQFQEKKIELNDKSTIELHGRNGMP